ncbi:MAG: hypothetical protein LBI39_02670 [Puniceicoccales bacterium]|jgi:hypothetical protein|nr:hypothetical protein [Puniceicoccales bacterium]
MNTIFEHNGIKLLGTNLMGQALQHSLLEISTAGGEDPRDKLVTFLKSALATKSHPVAPSEGLPAPIDNGFSASVGIGKGWRLNFLYYVLATDPNGKPVSIGLLPYHDQGGSFRSFLEQRTPLGWVGWSPAWRNAFMWSN